MNLVIIEGVGKQDTIKKYLGSNFEVIATKGHVRDLPERTLGVNVNDNFKPQYTIMPDKEDIVKKLKAKSAKADRIYLATDPDREGESISWHLCNILELDPNSPVRIEFNEISKKAVTSAIDNPRAINLNLVDAQQARRVLDRLLGYKLSPILCKKIQPNLSAGRVQSVALKLIVDRENEIRNFVKEEYWTLIANLFKPDNSNLIFKSSLTKHKNKKINIPNKEEMDKVLSDVKQNKFIVSSVKKSISHVKASAPYITSTMQQDALNKLGMNLKKASMSAQQLYEGVDLGSEGKVALITYIRTDSVRVSPDAMKMAKDYIIKNYGENYVPKTPNQFKVKKSAQDAHEAIRPISLERTPESVKQYLTPDNYKLYNMIYKKFLASQMADATFDTISADINNGDYLFHTTGKTPVFDGFNVIYKAQQTAKNKAETETEEDDSENAELPELKEGDELSLSDLIPSQKFTKPLPRFTEASLVKEMESKGIGRPATYTPTILVLSNRKYTDKDGKYLIPTELGFKVSELLNKYFDNIIDIKFTALMEELLDEVANSGRVWQDIVTGFYNKFIKRLALADKDSVTFKEPPKPTDLVCDKCGHPMVIKTGRFGEFIACSNYPACKNIQNINKKPVVACPKCGGNVFEKKSKKGKVFYGCDNYPNCDFASWELPIEEKCPKCNSYMTQKTIYGNIRKKCSSCDYSEQVKKVTKDVKVEDQINETEQNN